MPIVESHKLTNKSGFTILELMVVVTIAAILMGIAIPSFMEAIRSNRLTTYANELVTALNLARSEAVKRGVNVTVRRVDNLSSTNLGVGANWENGWDVFVDQQPVLGEFDDDGDANLCEAGEDCLLKTYMGMKTSYTLRGNSGAAPDNFTSFIRFSPSGQSNNIGSFVVCDDRDGNSIPEQNTSRLIVVNSVGRVSMGRDTNNDGIPNTDNVPTADSNLTLCTPI
jgi:type IV fimbrial biogenesis protein FimT